MGRRPIKPSKASSTVFALNPIDIKSFWLHLFSKRWNTFFQKSRGKSSLGGFFQNLLGDPIVDLGGEMNRILDKNSVSANVLDKLRRGGGVK